MNTAPKPATLGLWALTALVIGNMIGSGTFLLPSALAPYGLYSLYGWALSLVGAVALALVFARLAQLYPGSGGPQVYARAAFGDGAGFVVAWCYWVSSWCGVAAIAVAFAGNVGPLLPELASSPARSAITAAMAIVLCLICNLSGLKAASLLQSVTAALKLLPLLLLGLLGWFWFDPQLAATPIAAEPGFGTTTPLWSVMSTVAALTLWAFLGLECATVPAGAVADPRRTIPLATVLGTLIAGIASVLACTVVLGLLPAEQLAQSSAPLADAARIHWGKLAGLAMSVAAAIACFGAVNGWVLIQAQVAAAAARDGLFPRWLGTNSPQETPRAALVLGSTLALGLVLANFNASLVQVYTFSILLSTAACLLPYLLCTAAAFRRSQTAAQLTITVVAGLFSVWAMIGTGQEALGWGLVLIAAGLPVAAWVRWQTRRTGR